MAKQRMIVTDDQLLIDIDLLFNSIRESGGDWEKVEKDMRSYLESVKSMALESESNE
jgi:hypothetical protein